MYKSILVTGGSGVLGTAIKAISTDFPDRNFNYLSSKDCDLTKLDEVLSVFGAHRPDAMLHFAAISGGIQYSMKYPATMLRDNVLMNINVLEAARLLGIKKTAMTLSAGMYPVTAPIPLSEDDIHNGYPHETNYSYSFAKRLIDPSIKAYRAEYGVNVIGLISNGIFGPNMNFRPEEAVMVGDLIRRFYENRDSGQNVTIWGDGSPLREYTYSEDLARAFMWCLDHYDDAQVLNAGSTEEVSVKDTAYMIADAIGVPRERVVFDTSKPSGIYKKGTDNSRFVNLSGFKYRDFKTGLEATVKWFVENYHGQIRL